MEVVVVAWYVVVRKELRCVDALDLGQCAIAEDV